MKYNTTEFSGDALRDAVTQYSSTSPDTTDTPAAGSGRHAATHDEERKSVAPQADKEDVDRKSHNGTSVDETQSAERTAPVTPAHTATPDSADTDAKPVAEHQPADTPAPPAPVEIDSLDSLLTDTRHDAHTAMAAADTLDADAQRPDGASPAPPLFTPPAAPQTPRVSAPLPPAPAGTYRARPQQRIPDAWDAADEPTQLGIVVPDRPAWAEQPPQAPARPAAPEPPGYNPATPDFSSRGPARLHQDGHTQQLPHMQLPAPQHPGHAQPNYGGYPAPNYPGYTGPEYSGAPQAVRMPAPNNYDQSHAAPPRPAGQQQPNYGNPDMAVSQQQPAQSPLPAPPPPPNLSSEKTDHAFVLESRRKEGPSQGWRGALNRIHIPIRKSAAEQAYDQDIATINRTFRYSKTIGVAAFKGGVGKTTCALSLASTVAEHRTKGEVVAVDTDDRGSLARRVHGEQTSDIQRFAYDPDLRTPNEVKSHMMSNSHRLAVLGSNQSPRANGLKPEEYIRAQEILQSTHLFVFVDMDTSAASPAYETIMRSLDALVLVTATSIDSAEAGRSMRDWLRARNLHDLAAHTLVLINHQSPAKPFLDLESTASYYQNNESCPVLEIPWDPHLAEASSVNLDLLDKGTRRQFVKASATLIGLLPQT